MLLFEVYSNWTWQNLNTIQGYQTPQTVIGVLPGIEFLATDKLALAAGASFDLAGQKRRPKNYSHVNRVLYLLDSRGLGDDRRYGSNGRLNVL